MIANLKSQAGEFAALVPRHLPFVVFLAFLVLYTATLMPDALPADSGEFQLVAATAGVAHPPGYPLYTMLGWLFAHLPLGPSPAWRVSLFSAATAAVTVALVFQTGRRLTGSTWGGLVAALALGSTTFWATGTKASIRPLTIFFTALCLHALTEHRWQIADRGPRSTDRYLTLFALSLSLGFTHHYASAVFPAIAFVAYLLLIDPALLRQPRRWLKPATAFALGLLVLVYLPLRGAPDLGLSTLSGFLHYFLGLGFEGDMFALNLFDRLVILPTLLRFQFNTALLLAAVLGALLLLWRDRKLALLLLGSFFLHTVIVLTYRAPQTVEYEMPAYVPLALLVAVSVGKIANLQSRKTASLRVCRSAAVVIVLTAGLVNLLAHLPSYITLSQSHDAREYAETLLRDAPADAVVLSNWHWFTPLRYLQEVEGLRSDVSVKYIFPQGRSLAQNWVDGVEAHVHERPVIVVHYYEQAYGQLPYRFEPLGQAFLVHPDPNFRLPPGLTPLDVSLDKQVALLGYRLESSETEPSRPLVLTLAWSPTITPTTDLSLFAQLVGYDGRLWSAARDVRHPGARLVAGEVIVERFVIHPLLHAPPGDYTLVVGVYLPGEPGAPRLTSAGGADVVRLDTTRLGPSTRRPVTKHGAFVRFAGGPTLIGADYDASVPGQVRAYLHWAGPGRRSTLQLLDADGVMLAQGAVPDLVRGEYTTTAFDLLAAPARAALLDGEQPRRWNLLSSKPAPLPPPRPDERYVPLGDAFVFTGFEGPTGELEPGAEVTLGVHFLGVRPLERDYIVSTALTGLNPDETWAWRSGDDSVPALGAIPTLKWIRNSAVFDPHRLSVPPGAPRVPTVGSLVVYDHFTHAPLPPLDERLGPTIPLGIWTMARP